MDKPQSTRRRKARRRVMVLLVLCCAVFALFLARLAWLQFAMADHYAQKMAEASSASYAPAPQHAARGAVADRSGTVLAQDETVYDVYLRVPAPPGTNLRETVNTIAALTGGKDVETQLAAFCSAVSAGELPVTQGFSGQHRGRRLLPRRAGAKRRGAAGRAGRTPLAGWHNFAPHAGYCGAGHRRNSGPLPGPRGWRWTRRSAKTVWKPPTTPCCAGGTASCRSTSVWTV